jgi:quinol-cytochrome oxidoreductase complex cytochrome b subunit
MIRDTPSFFVGISWGIILFVLFLNLPFTDNSKAQKAIQDCEKNLPRNQHCKITAIPEEIP